MESDKETEKIRRRWDRTYQEYPLQQLPWEEGGPSAELVALIESGVVEKGAALDICCGSANNAIYLAKQGFTCYGIDISPTAIGHAQEKVASEKVSCELISGNVLQLPYPDGSFTLVFDRGCFHSIPPEDRETFVQGVHRVLKTTGKYQLLCFSSRDHPSTESPYSFSPEDIQRYFHSLFKIHSIQELSPKVKGTKHYFLSVLMGKIG